MSWIIGIFASSALRGVNVSLQGLSASDPQDESDEDYRVRLMTPFHCAQKNKVSGHLVTPEKNEPEENFAKVFHQQWSLQALAKACALGSLMLVLDGVSMSARDSNETDPQP